eukprot:COSAG02_NODE_4943_length_4805_cov_20.761581_3_plen_54_part_00
MPHVLEFHIILDCIVNKTKLERSNMYKLGTSMATEWSDWLPQTHISYLVRQQK